eukprot:TRINITY_DN3738_c0_g1_i1.p1 TRINITY_DN3738_c0_g1~~TRINITY_DN3738_c0_g1_i1.p1  ORF type:complete len:837 (-),score=586.38 TRINITY_DN3738_c0_g1_i1:115-2625(-)
MSSFDDQAGAKPGLEVWRVEEMKPVRQKDFTGHFFSGDSYLVLHTFEDKYGRKKMDLHFWLGKDSSQDERGAAAYLTVELDDKLGGEPVQHREVQGHESDKFKALFKGGLIYQDGGVDSAFNHVEPDKYDPRLFHLKGKRNVSVAQCERKASSLNSGDVFILDLGLDLYQWNGKEANKYEKFKALEVLTRINNEERGARANLHFLDEDVNDTGDEAKDFWAQLGDKADVKTAEEGGDDAEAAKKHGENVLFQLSDASGEMEMKEVARGKLSHSQLDTADVFIVDHGAEVFAWVGKGTTKDEKRAALKYATDYLAQHGRPDWTPCTRVVEGGEPPMFRSLFHDWPQRTAPRWNVNEPKPAKELSTEVDMSALVQRRQAEEEKMIDTSGKIEVWRIENMAMAKVDEALHGQFFMGDSYVLLYTYMKKNREAYIIYFWQGRDSSTDEKGASALFAKELDDKLGGDPVQVRVVQNKEPKHFLALFKGRMIVHQGGCASGFANVNDVDSYDTDGVSLFHVRGTNALNTRAVQVEEEAASLNSGDCFVLLTPETMYVWQGKGANADEKEVASNIAKVLQGNRQVVEVPEGSEPEEFWAALGGKGEYAQDKAMAAEEPEPRLFWLTTGYKAHSLHFEEIFDFTQDDLINDDAMILDAYNEVFVWIGSEANKTEQDEAIKKATEYLQAVDNGKRKDAPIYRVRAGEEPPQFTQHFLGWNEDKSLDFTDPYAARLAALEKDGKVSHTSSGGAAAGADEQKEAPPKKKAPAKLERVTLDDVGYKKMVLSLEDLRNNNFDKNEVDTTRKQDYLSDEDFQATFNMTREEFAKLAAWRQKQAKQKVGLF